ncbi:MAG TPA: hypothetical protein RMH85_26080 [Polyangiaceae bacterium LLY-WYZ-15_(1-7)]|nr:hypothetical protein [Myxococcales bacterium]MAT29213.1 hypothetical protein [Sandaracinus sp.]HJK93247.1 hypothetical protein [Polyangiaceae bacterium LLY-WYZ-15_(1-7)]MBJ71035.1 hypothetical protein [Sandaracinus sp.]HJL04095.1 hypothetical protein [Polyangiaceae bacterium LLY-WYZ-15_(1-7)]
MAGGGGGGKLWIYMLVVGGVLVGAAMGMHAAEVHITWLHATLLAVGGLAVVFGSCEAMIKCVEGIGERLDWNQFVAGTFAGLASNIPEVVMLGFVLAAEPRVGFIVTCLTLHVGAMVFGGYSALLPRDATGHARLPDALVKISTDLFAAAAGVFLGTGLLMVMLNTFEAGHHDGEGLGVADLYVLGGALLFVEAIALWQLVTRFAADEEADEREDLPPEKDEGPSWGVIAGYGVLGIATSVVGGHAVGDFADILVSGLEAAGYPEMVGALILSVFAAAGAIAMVFASHAKGLYEVALASASGQINQVPFVVLPVALILLAVFAQTGVIPRLEHGGVLPIDLETTSVTLLAFPPFLILWKAVQDDGKVNWVETASMLCVFGLIVYFLAMHG